MTDEYKVRVEADSPAMELDRSAHFVNLFLNGAFKRTLIIVPYELGNRESVLLLPFTRDLSTYDQAHMIADQYQRFFDRTQGG